MSIKTVLDCRRLAGSLVVCLFAAVSVAQETSKKPDFPPFAEVTKGFEKVVSTMDGKTSMYTIWVRKKDNQMLAELPKDYARKKYFIALTVASGERYAGLQSGEMYVYWKKFDKRLALIQPNYSVRSTGDAESKASVKRLFTDRVIMEVPIVTLSPSKTPVIDMDRLLVANSAKFFGMRVNPNLASIKTAKAFPKNVELAFEAPAISGSSLRGLGRASSGGQFKTLHYSISEITSDPSYKTRVADQRVGYFLTGYTDLGKYTTEEKQTRYINRWLLEKSDPSLKMSPPKKPIVFYIEHTTPKRYRYWVKQGILYWNVAFEKVGIRDAIEVLQQDAGTNKYMDIDPEDVRYNFVRWLNNDVGTAIGPSRVNPLTGQILDADIILTDGWIRHFDRQYNEIMPKLAIEGFSPQTLAWINTRPNWDPRILLAHPSERLQILHARARELSKPFAGHPMANADPTLLGDDEFDGLTGAVSQKNGMCLAAEGKTLDLAMARMALRLAAAADADEKKKKKDDEEVEGSKDENDVKVKDEDEARDSEDKDDEDDDKDDDDKDEKDDEKPSDKEDKDKQQLDGIPEDFIGPLLAELVAHEVGHTLGLRHNFKASSVYSLAEINSGELGDKPHAGSVMDYLPINMPCPGCGEHKGHYTVNGVGPYDIWAIEYGYTMKEGDLKKILQRVAEPELVYGTDEDAIGPDPRARRYDFSKNPLDFANQQIELAKYHRERLLDKFVEEGDSWAKARRGYEMTLSFQTRALSMMSNWVGGTLISRDKKGDKNAHTPVTVVPSDQQRSALQFVIENAFRDGAFGLTPKLLQHLGADQWLDGNSLPLVDADWPVHDRIMGIQASTLTMLMNPDTLRLVYDNELRTPEDEDALTLPELLDTISDEIWQLGGDGKATARKPRISSLRRNLQREHLERLIDLTVDSGFSAAYRPISNLSLMKLRAIKKKVDGALEKKDELDPYSRAHLEECQLRIEKALDPQFVLNNNGGGRRGAILILGQPAETSLAK